MLNLGSASTGGNKSTWELGGTLPISGNKEISYFTNLKIIKIYGDY
jgi:hypothetical protein